MNGIRVIDKTDERRGSGGRLGNVIEFYPFPLEKGGFSSFRGQRQDPVELSRADTLRILPIDVINQGKYPGNSLTRQCGNGDNRRKAQEFGCSF